MPAVTELLRDADPSIRVFGASAVERPGPAAKATVPELTRLLSDPWASGREAGARALGNIGPALRARDPATRRAARRPRGKCVDEGQPAWSISAPWRYRTSWQRSRERITTPPWRHGGGVRRHFGRPARTGRAYPACFGSPGRRVPAPGRRRASRLAPQLPVLFIVMEYYGPCGRSGTRFAGKEGVCAGRDEFPPGLLTDFPIEKPDRGRREEAG